MKACIGYINISVSYLYELISGFNEFKVNVVLNGEFNEENEVFIFPNVALFAKYKKKLDKLKCVVFICDIRENIEQVFGIESLEDNQIRRDLHKLLKRKKHVKIKLLEKEDSLIKLIENIKKGRVLHIYNQITYSLQGVRRTKVKQLMLQYLFGEIKEKLFIEEVGKYVNESNNDYFNDFIHFMRGSAGPLCSALKEAKRRRFSKNINYEELCNKYGSDTYETQFLARTYVDNFKK